MFTMQMAFKFGVTDDIAWLRERLRGHFGNPGMVRLRTPVGQLVKSIISSRTRDEVSRAASDRLETRYPTWLALAHAPVGDIQEIIKDVSFPEDKARYLQQTLQVIAASYPDFDLTFLARMSVPKALDWLECLPGVGRKVAASTLNFSTLKMPSFVIDTHILRLLRRFGFVTHKAPILKAYDVVMGQVSEWNASELSELHMLLKRLGQTICRANDTYCHHCPIRERCRSIR